MKNFIGKRVRCVATGKVYTAIDQAEGELLCRDEDSGRIFPLSSRRVVRHSPSAICVGAVIQTLVLADYAPLGDSAYLIRAGFLGSFASVLLTGVAGMSAPVMLLAYLLGGLLGVMASASSTFRQRVRRRTKERLATKEAEAREDAQSDGRGSGVPSSEIQY